MTTLGAAAEAPRLLLEMASHSGDSLDRKAQFEPTAELWVQSAAAEAPVMAQTSAVTSQVVEAVFHSPVEYNGRGPRAQVLRVLRCGSGWLIRRG